MNSSHWFPWPMLFFLFIIIYCPIVAGRLHSVKFPTQRTGSCSMASDFLGLICTEAGRDQPASGLFVRSLPRAPVNLPSGHFLPGTQHRQQPRWPSQAVPRSPWEKFPLSALNLHIMSFLFTYHVYCLSSRLCGNVLSKGNNGEPRNKPGEITQPWSGRPSSGFVIKKQNTGLPYKWWFYTFWLLNYLLMKSFITSA